MTKVAFYAPMKSPYHKIPSGDRQIAQNFLTLFEKMGFSYEVMSDLRSWNSGDLDEQKMIKEKAFQEAHKITQTLLQKPKAERPDLWFTYHLYHKAPDWIGPYCAQQLNIPYVIAEASLAQKQKSGPWAFNFEQNENCLRQANLVVNLGKHDQEGIIPYLSSPDILLPLNPFLTFTPSLSESDSDSRSNMSQRFNLPRDKVWLLSVGMMRQGDKTRSYLKLAQSLIYFQQQHKKTTRDWHLIVIGDGPESRAIQKAFSPLSDHISFVGHLPREDLDAFYKASDLFVWPAIKEAFGMALLEAQAHGLPAIVGNYGSVSEIVEDGKTGFVLKTPDLDITTDDPFIHEFSTHLELLLSSSKQRQIMSFAAQKKVAQNHSLEYAQKTLSPALKRIIL